MAQIPDLALGHQLVQRRERLGHRRHRIRGVQLVQVDVVGTQPPQRFRDGPPDVGSAALGPGGRAVTHVRALVAELRGQHDLIPAAAEDLAERALRAAAPAICVRGVEQGDTSVDGRVHHRARPVHVEAGAEVVAAEPQHRHQQSGITKRPITHARIIWTPGRAPFAGHCVGTNGGYPPAMRYLSAVDACRTVLRQAQRSRSCAGPRSCRRRAGSGRWAGRSRGQSVRPSAYSEMAVDHFSCRLLGRVGELPRGGKFTPSLIRPQLI